MRPTVRQAHHKVTAHGSTGSRRGYTPWFDRLTMRCNLLILQHLILSLSKDEANIMSFSAACKLAAASAAALLLGLPGSVLPQHDVKGFSRIAARLKAYRSSKTG